MPRAEAAAAVPPSWFVVNPYAGRVRRAALRADIRRRGEDVVVSRRVPEASDRLVVAVGGDGTVNRVINRCDPRHLRLGIIPRGTANDLCRALAIPRDFDAACDVLAQEHFEAIDLLSVNGARFATCGGVGLAAAVAARANRWKGPRSPLRGAGPAVYVAAALASIAGPDAAPVAARVTVDGTRFTGPLATLLVSNQPRFGRWFQASPQASNRDGRLSVTLLRAPESRARLLWVATQLLLGRPDRCAEIVQLEGRRAAIEIDRELAFFGDGEVLVRARRFELEVLPRALRVATPRPVH